MAKRANSYSGAMVMTCKSGENPSNGASPKVDTHFRTRLNSRHSPSQDIRPLIEGECNNDSSEQNMESQIKYLSDTNRMNDMSLHQQDFSFEYRLWPEDFVVIKFN